MQFGHAISSGFQRSVDFTGRSSRSEYWWWTLFNVIVLGLAEVLISVASTEHPGPAFVFYLILNLAFLLPSLAVTVRRLHDLDRSAWWMLIAIVPLVGAILLIVWFCTKGSEGSNRFGVDPLG